MSDEQVAQYINQFEQGLPTGLHGLLARRDGATLLAEALKKTFTPAAVAAPSNEQQAWERLGQFYTSLGRYHEALGIYAALYDHMCVSQQPKGVRSSKGMPLIWMSDCFHNIGYSLIGRRYMMLTLIEDAIKERGVITPDTTGTYFRLVWGGGLSDTELKRYAKAAYQYHLKNKKKSLYPEHVLQKLDQSWITEIPSQKEVGVYATNARYINHLISQLGKDAGESLELLAEYLLSCMPGCRTTRRRRSSSTDYDVICSMEGFDVDFRSELGRYFVCECKDLKKNRVDITMMAKFCRILDSTKARFGIIFTTHGISGENKTKDAEREQLKVYQDRGMVIVVVNRDDIEQVAKGANFISILRDKYERVRLDLRRTVD